MSRFLGCLLVASFVISPCLAAEFGMKQGTPKLKSAGPLAFGEHGVLFVGDTKAATVFALDTQDTDGDANEVKLEMKEVDRQAAAMLGTEKVTINDFAVNPISGIGYISVTSDDNKTVAICRLLPNGEVEEMSLENINYSKVELPNAPDDKVVGEGRRRGNARDQSITDLAFMEGKVLVSGIAGNDRESNVRELVFPFFEADKGVNVEIYHGAHGKYESTSTVRTFVPFKIGDEPYLLAGFVCTPLVKFPLQDLKGEKIVRGTTVAELGNRNVPLDMFVYKKDGQDYLLLSNSARGVMKISTEDVEREEGITKRIQGTAGQTYETIEALKGVEQMDKLNDKHAVVMARSETGSLDMQTIELP